MLLPDGSTYVGAFAADRFEGHGQYRYADGSVYTGAWAAGKKHGPGVYWDTAKVGAGSKDRLSLIIFHINPTKRS